VCYVLWRIELCYSQFCSDCFNVLVILSHLLSQRSDIPCSFRAPDIVNLTMFMSYSAVAMIIFVTLTCGPIVMYLGWKDIRRDILVCLIPGLWIGTGVGNFLLVNTDEDLMKRILGCVFLVLGGYRMGSILYNDYHTSRESDEDSCSVAANEAEQQHLTSITDADGDADGDAGAIELESVDDTKQHDVTTSTLTTNVPKHDEDAADEEVQRYPLHGLDRPWRPHSWQFALVLFIVGCLAGVATGAFGVGGPPVILFFAFYDDCTKNEIRCKCFVLSGRFVQLCVCVCVPLSDSLLSSTLVFSFQRSNLGSNNYNRHSCTTWKCYCFRCDQQ
jgi:hypothetical protein